MAKRSAKDPTAWLSTPAGMAAYQSARREAQAKANESGYDYGLERNDLFKSFDRRKPGHGPRG